MLENTNRSPAESVIVNRHPNSQTTVIHSFVHSIIRLFIRLFIHSFIQTYIYSFKHTFIHSFMHLFIQSCIHSFLRVSIQYSCINSLKKPSTQTNLITNVWMFCVWVFYFLIFCKFAFVTGLCTGNGNGDLNCLILKLHWGGKGMLAYNKGLL